MGQLRLQRAGLVFGLAALRDFLLQPGVRQRQRVGAGLQADEENGQVDQQQEGGGVEQHPVALGARDDEPVVVAITADRKRVVTGKMAAVVVGVGGSRTIKNKTTARERI